MKRIALVIVMLLGVSSAIWLARGAAPVKTAVPVAAQGGGGGGGAGAFVPVDVYLDTGGRQLGAYQFEVTAKDAIIVGLEGGEAHAFKNAPYYDPAALQGNKIIVASFSTDSDLPAGKTRVARLHFMLAGGSGGGSGMSAENDFSDLARKLVVATDGDGHSIEARLFFRAFQGEKR